MRLGVRPSSRHSHFGIPFLTSPTALKAEASRVLKVVTEATASLLSNRPGQPLPLLLRQFDAISNELCKLADTTDCVRRLYPSGAVRSAANEAHIKVSCLMQQLNTNRELAALVCRPNLELKSLDPLMTSVLHSIRRDFELLQRAESRHVQELQKRIDQLTYAYESKLGDSKMQDLASRHVRAPAKTSDDGSIRLLEDLIRSRFGLAKALGYSSPIELILQDKALSTPSSVVSFLSSESSRISSIIPATKSREMKHYGTDLTSCLNFLSSLLKVWFPTIDAQWSQDPLHGITASFSENSVPLGRIYFDLHAQSRAQAGPAHYTLHARIPPHQPAVVVISLPLQANSCLLWSESRLLFHEFGHALHALLSAVDWQVLAGTRCPPDLVEFPSTLLELVHDRALAKEGPDAGAAMPRSIVDRAWQIQIAHLDHLLHSREPADRDKWTLDLVEETQSTVCSSILPFVPGASWHARIPHFATYGGFYYTYPLCLGLAETFYQRHLDKDPFSLESGSALRSLLAKGGTLSLADLSAVNVY